MTVEKLINSINELKLVQNKYWDEMDWPDEIQNILDNCEVVEGGLDVDKHRWYELSTTVYKTKDDEIFGIQYITQLYSESSSYDDIYHYINAFPMGAIESVTYVKK